MSFLDKVKAAWAQAGTSSHEHGADCDHDHADGDSGSIVHPDDAKGPNQEQGGGTRSFVDTQDGQVGDKAAHGNSCGCNHGHANIDMLDASALANVTAHPDVKKDEATHAADCDCAAPDALQATDVNKTCCGGNCHCE